MITFIPSFTFSDIIAFSAFLLSLWAIYSTRRSAKVQEKLNALLLEKAQSEIVALRKADVKAHLVRLSSTGEYRFKVYNQGDAPARNISINLPEGDTFVSSESICSTFPLDVLSPSDSVKLAAVGVARMERRWSVRITWSDDHDDKNEAISYLEIPYFS